MLVWRQIFSHPAPTFPKTFTWLYWILDHQFQHFIFKYTYETWLNTVKGHPTWTVGGWGYWTFSFITKYPFYMWYVISKKRIGALPNELMNFKTWHFQGCISGEIFLGNLALIFPWPNMWCYSKASGIEPSTPPPHTHATTTKKKKHTINQLMSCSAMTHLNEFTILLYPYFLVIGHSK